MSHKSTAQNDVEHDEESIRDTQWVGPIEFTASSRHAAAEIMVKLAEERSGRHVHLANAYTVALADKSSDYRDVLGRPAINFPDGKPISWISVLSRHAPRLKQVRGPRLFLDTIDIGRTSGVKHFLLGSTPDVLAALEKNLKSKFPGVIIAGTESPPFRPLDEGELDQQDRRIRESGAEIVWVGLGTPKQDFEAKRLALRLPVVAVAIGAAFDFAAGSAREAPNWMSAFGLEWVFRLACEPRRLWRRYLFGNVRFLVAALARSYARNRPRPRSGDVT